MGAPNDDLVNPRDFISIKLAIEFQNLTANSHPLHDDVVSLSEIRDRVLVFELPETSCKLDHNVMIKLGRRDSNANAQTPVLFQSTGKIARVKELKDAKIRVVVTLIQFDDVSWVSFMQLFARRQEEITEFLRQVKP
ncbi:MAG: hypothetical protein HY074_19545 [Deltaproteobacteria bacterium]|nr:hypothetical protein [Deltaproteobacteria bacterium]